ncbi:MAG: alkaline phosphatase family protein, partial [Deferribacterales bacterium]
MLKKIFLVLILVLIPLCLLATEPRTVVVISIDALHPDAISLAKPKNILYLMGKGVYSLNGKSETPPKTLINHTAMVVGKSPEESGYNFNNWKIGDRKVSIDTIFHDAKKVGYKTFYVYSKQNLGFLENDGIDKSYFAKDESVYLGQKIVEETKCDYFLFLHISGLDFIG